MEKNCLGMIYGCLGKDLSCFGVLEIYNCYKIRFFGRGNNLSGEPKMLQRHTKNLTMQGKNMFGDRNGLAKLVL